MRAQAYLIALLISLLMWSMSFFVIRESYRLAHSSGIISNQHLHHRLSDLLEG